MPGVVLRHELSLSHIYGAYFRVDYKDGVFSTFYWLRSCRVLRGLYDTKQMISQRALPPAMDIYCSNKNFTYLMSNFLFWALKILSFNSNFLKIFCDGRSAPLHPILKLTSFTRCFPLNYSFIESSPPPLPPFQRAGSARFKTSTIWNIFLRKRKSLFLLFPM